MNNSQISEEDFLERLHTVWGDQIEYIPGTYTLASKPVQCNCKIHGPFTVKQASQLYMQKRPIGCPKCGEWRNYSRKRDKFIEKALSTKHGADYGYSLAHPYKADMPSWSNSTYT